MKELLVIPVRFAFIPCLNPIWRKPRLLIEGGFYHVMLRGHGGSDIFFSDQDRAEFERLVAEGVTRFGHRIHAYC